MPINMHSNSIFNPSIHNSNISNIVPIDNQNLPNTNIQNNPNQIHSPAISNNLIQNNRKYWQLNCQEQSSGIWRTHDYDPDIIKYLLMNLHQTEIAKLMNGQTTTCCNDCTIDQNSSNNMNHIKQQVDKKVYNTAGNTAITSHCNLMNGNVQSRCYNHIGWIEPHILCPKRVESQTKDVINAVVPGGDLEVNNRQNPVILNNDRKDISIDNDNTDINQSSNSTQSVMGNNLNNKDNDISLNIEDKNKEFNNRNSIKNDLNNKETNDKINGDQIKKDKNDILYNENKIQDKVKSISNEKITNLHDHQIKKLENESNKALNKPELNQTNKEPLFKIMQNGENKLNNSIKDSKTNEKQKISQENQQNNIITNPKSTENIQNAINDKITSKSNKDNINHTQIQPPLSQLKKSDSQTSSKPPNSDKKNITVDLNHPEPSDCDCNPCCGGECTTQPNHYPYHPIVQPDPPQPLPLPNLRECAHNSDHSLTPTSIGATLECRCNSTECDRQCHHCPCGLNCDPRDECNCRKTNRCVNCFYGCDEHGNCLCPNNCEYGCKPDGQCNTRKTECLHRSCIECSGEHNEICHKCADDPQVVSEVNAKCHELDPASQCTECSRCKPDHCKMPHCRTCVGAQCDVCLECAAPTTSSCTEQDLALNCQVCKDCIKCHDPNCAECGGPECKICTRCKQSAFPGYCAELDVADCATCLRCKNCVNEKCGKCDPPFCDNCRECKKPANEYCSKLMLFSEGNYCRHCEDGKCTKCNAHLPNCGKCGGPDCDRCLECVDDGMCVRDPAQGCACVECKRCEGSCGSCSAPACKCDHCGTCANSLCAACEFPGCTTCTACKACASAMCAECSAPHCSDCLKCKACLGDCDLQDCAPPNCTCRAVKFTRTVLLSDDTVPVD